MYIDEYISTETETFHEILRSCVSIFLIFIFLLIIAHLIVIKLKIKQIDDLYFISRNDQCAYQVALSIVTFSIAITLAAVFLLPISILSNEIMLKYPKSYYMQWINQSLIQNLWNTVSLSSNITVFILMPFATFFLDSEGFSGIMRSNIHNRVMEAVCFLFVTIFLILGVLWILCIPFRENNTLVVSLRDLWQFYLPLVHSSVSLIGVVLLCLLSPLGCLHVLLALATVLQRVCLQKVALVNNCVEEAVKKANFDRKSINNRENRYFNQNQYLIDKSSTNIDNVKKSGNLSDNAVDEAVKRVNFNKKSINNRENRFSQNQYLIDKSSTDIDNCKNNFSNDNLSNNCFEEAVKRVNFDRKLINNGENRYFNQNHYFDDKSSINVKSNFSNSSLSNNCVDANFDKKSINNSESRYFNQNQFLVDKSSINVGNCKNNFSNSKSSHKNKISKNRYILEIGSLLLLLIIVIAIIVLLLCYVVVNIIGIVVGLHALPQAHSQIELGQYPSSTLGCFGAVLQIVLILSLLFSSIFALYHVYPMKGCLPQLHCTNIHTLMKNSMCLLLLCSASPIQSRLLGVTAFNPLGTFGHLDWLDSGVLVLTYNAGFLALLGLGISKEVLCTSSQHKRTVVNSVREVITYTSPTVVKILGHNIIREKNELKTA